MKRIFSILVFLLCVLVVNAQTDNIVRKQSQKRTTTQTSTAAKKQTTTTKPAKKSSAPAPTIGTSSYTPTIKTYEANGVSFQMVEVRGGTFTMGVTNEQGSEPYDDKKPAHSVTLSSYYIGETQVTQALWKAVMGSNPSGFKGDDLPVEYVSWHDCQKFIEQLNKKLGKTFRLPTEAEWEFAARGGNKSMGYQYSGSNNVKDVAWYDGNSGGKTHPVKTKKANELGLYDMSGNVWEWCNDWYDSQYYSSSPSNNPTGPSSGTNRVCRGGSWIFIARNCRSSIRGSLTPDYRDSGLGLRLCLSE